jgi:hypothetical protein
MGLITMMAALLFAGLVLAGGILWLRINRGGVKIGPTWGCGYVAPTPRMQYTSSSFAQMLVVLFGWALRPRTRRPEIVGLFPQQAEFKSNVPDPVLDEAVLPTIRFGAWLFRWFRVFQQGSTQAYLLYILLALLILLAWITRA